MSLFKHSITESFKTNTHITSEVFYANTSKSLQVNNQRFICINIFAIQYNVEKPTIIFQ